MEHESKVQNHKVMAMESDKRERLINAALTEFCKGYKGASTDIIVREAGISKGLLFHYFGTKKGLLKYLFEFSMEVLTYEFYGLIDFNQKDFLERLWQVLLIKADLSYKYTDMFDFLIAIYMKDEKELDEIKEDCDNFYKEVWQVNNSKIFEGIDLTLFRDDIDVQKCIDIIRWSFFSYSNSHMIMGKTMKDIQDSYEDILREVREYIDVFRKTFYK